MSAHSELVRLHASCLIKVIITLRETHLTGDELTLPITATKLVTALGNAESYLKNRLKLERDRTCVFVFVSEQGAALLEDFGAEVTWVDAVF